MMSSIELRSSGSAGGTEFDSSGIGEVPFQSNLVRRHALGTRLFADNRLLIRALLRNSGEQLQHAGADLAFGFGRETGGAGPPAGVTAERVQLGRRNIAFAAVGQLDDKGLL